MVTSHCWGEEVSPRAVSLEAVFIVTLFWKCTKCPQPREGGIVAVVIGLWIAWVGTLSVSIHTIRGLAHVHSSPFDRARLTYVSGGAHSIEECRRSVLYCRILAFTTVTNLPRLWASKNHERPLARIQLRCSSPRRYLGLS